MKQELYKEIDAQLDDLKKMSDYIFDHPEYANKEYKAVEVITEYLENEGFSIERGIAGLDTAFRAVYEWKTGGPSIGLLCEYDALEKLGHACGHHLQGPCIAGAAVALKHKLNDQDKPYKIVVYGTPDEELFGSKILMAERGCFQDIDVALMVHGSNNTCCDVKSLCQIWMRIDYHGKASHAAITPDQGRSAFDAFLLTCNGLEFMREHVRDDSRIHYSVVQANSNPCIVSDLTSAYFIVRSSSLSYGMEMRDRFLNIVKGACMMTDTTFDYKLESIIKNKIPVLSLNELLMENAAEAKVPRLAPPRSKAGSSDLGNVMYMVPGSCIRIAFVPEEAPSHSAFYVENGKNEHATDVLRYGGYTLSGAAYDLIYKEEKLNQIKEEFQRNLQEYC